MLRREEAFTLIELVVVVTILGILIVMAVGFHTTARERAGDATARANLRIAEPAIEAYRTDSGTYEGMTLAALQTAYSPGVQGIEIVSGSATTYCVRASAGGRTWYKNGPSTPITTTACA